jgi:hypothetical protein
MPATTGGRPSSGTTRSGFQRRRRRAPASQGHPSQGRPTVGGGTGGRKPTVYRSPKPAPSRGGHPSRGRPTVGGGTKGRKPKRYKSPTQSVRKQRLARTRERQRMRRLQRSLRGSKAARPKGTEFRTEPRKGDSIAEYMERYKRDRERFMGAAPLESGVGKAIDKATGKGVAAAVDILEETTRPLHAVAAAERRAIKNIKEGKNPANLNVLKAGYEGAANKRKDTYSDVLGDLGVKKGPVRSVGGFVGDVVGDPLNYVTLGTAGVARTAAKEAGEAAAKKAARKGMSKAGQETVRRAAAKRAAARAPKNRGLTIGTRKRKTSGKTTALLSRKSGITNIGKTIRERSGVQDAGAHMRPDFRQKGVPREAHERVQSAAAARRAQMASGSRKTEALGRAFKKKHGTKDNERILDAIETRQISKLPKELREPAIRLRSEFRHMNRVERQAGVRAAERKNYVAHVRRQDVEGGGSKFPRIGGGLGAAKRRKVEGSLAKIREESPDLFTEDIPSILAKRGGQSSRTVAIANFERELAKTGRALTPKSYASIGDEEAIYHLVGGSKIRKVYPVEEGKGQAVKELEAALAGRSKNGQYVIANEKLVDDAVAHEMVAPAKGWPQGARHAEDSPDDADAVVPHAKPVRRYG